MNLIAKQYVKGTYGFVTTNNQFRILNELGFPYGKKSAIVRIPTLILKSNNKLVYARFLRGLFDTDGCLHFKNRRTGKNYSEFKKKYNYYPTIQITSISKPLIEDVEFILNKLGIKYFVYGAQPKDKRDSYKYVIIISGKERILKWMNLIGIKNSGKYTRYLV